MSGGSDLIFLDNHIVSDYHIWVSLKEELELQHPRVSDLLHIQITYVPDISASQAFNQGGQAWVVLKGHDPEARDSECCSSSALGSIEASAQMCTLTGGSPVSLSIHGVQFQLDGLQGVHVVIHMQGWGPASPFTSFAICFPSSLLFLHLPFSPPPPLQPSPHRPLLLRKKYTFK